MCLHSIKSADKDVKTNKCKQITQDQLKTSKKYKRSLFNLNLLEILTFSNYKQIVMADINKLGGIYIFTNKIIIRQLKGFQYIIKYKMAIIKKAKEHLVALRHINEQSRSNQTLLFEDLHWILIQFFIS
ncbi:hypothetical protein ABPG74_019828 [Tetrahymena malaccensis]